MVSRTAGHVHDALDPGLLEPVAIERLFGRQALRPIDHRLVDIDQLIEGIGSHSRMFVSTRIINGPAVNTLATVVHKVPNGLVALYPIVEGFQPRIRSRLLSFVEDDDPNVSPSKIVTRNQIFPFAFDNLGHHAPH